MVVRRSTEIEIYSRGIRCVFVIIACWMCVALSITHCQYIYEILLCKVVDYVFLEGPAPHAIIYSTPRHLRLPGKLVPEYDCYGCALYPSVRVW